MQTINNPLPAKKHIALVAHDGKKQELIDWCKQHKNTLAQHTLFATGTTGKRIFNEIGLNVDPFISGPLGGDQQIGAKIVEDQLHLLIFFWDPLSSQPHDPDIKALLRVAAVWNIPVACNRSSADFIIHSDLMNKVTPREVPDYQQYLANR